LLISQAMPAITINNRLSEGYFLKIVISFFLNLMNNNNPPHTAPDSYREPAETFAALQAECRQWQEDLQTLAASDDLFKVRTANT
jgi:hypothetical protein